MATLSDLCIQDAGHGLEYSGDAASRWSCVRAAGHWKRLDDVLPALENVYEDAAGSLRFEAVGGNSAALVRIQVANTDSKPHQFVVRCDSGAWGERSRVAG